MDIYGPVKPYILKESIYFLFGLQSLYISLPKLRTLYISLPKLQTLYISLPKLRTLFSLPKLQRKSPSRHVATSRRHVT